MITANATFSKYHAWQKYVKVSGPYIKKIRHCEIHEYSFTL
jgi:hypothetical protein